MITDLEDVLAIETSRNLGQVTGEATAVLKSLPAGTRKRLPLRARRSTKAIGALVALGGIVGLALALGLGLSQTERGTGKRENVSPAAELQPVGLGQRAAVDFDPLADKREHPTETSAVIDGIRSSTWSTETYSSGELQKAGVGIVIDAKPRVAAKQLELRTPTPGFQATIYVAPESTPATAPPAGWTRVGTTRQVGSTEKFDLDTEGRGFRRYLVWITTLPPDSQSAEISEILLFK